MSSSFIKALKCYWCSEYQLIEDINFPEDVFESIRQHKFDKNLLWKCNSCKNRSHGDDVLDSFAISMEKPPVSPETDVHTPYKSNKIDNAANSETELVKSDSSSLGSVSSRSSSCRSASPPATPDKDKSARKYTQLILKAIKIPHDDKLKNQNLIHQVLGILLNGMKENEDFKGVVNRLYPTGSAYNDLKITAATEYDINLVLKVPKCVKLSPEFFNGNCTFVKLNWESNAVLTDNSMKFLAENSDTKYLSPQKVLSWLQRHIDLTLQKEIKWPTDVLNVVNSASGPARTLIISTSFGYDISVDLVPVFEFDYGLLTSTPFYDKVNEIALDKNGNNYFFAVPKVCTEEKNISVSDSKLCWRLDFPNAEKFILSEKECAKSVIKILKIFRDKNDWKALASYYLKMVVILEILKDSSREYWKNGNMYQRLLDSLKQLAEYLVNGYLPHFLTQQNLIEKLNEQQCKNWSNRLKHAIKSWESDPQNIVSFLENDKLSS